MWPIKFLHPINWFIFKKAFCVKLSPQFLVALQVPDLDTKLTHFNIGNNHLTVN